jgi:protoporphyrinogen/coproporphyrinogen III oxidase
MAPTPMTTPVVIVGAGIAGLSAAYEFHKRGVPFVLLEAGARAGGVIFGEQVDGFVIDAGPDSLLIQKPEAIALCEELGLGSRLVPTKMPRAAYVQRGGRLHALPQASVLGIPTRVGPFIRTRLFSWPGKLRMAAELFVPKKREPGDESIGAFIGRRFGREAVTYLADPLLAGIHAGDVDRLSVAALFPRFVESEQAQGSLLKAFRRSQPAHQSADGVFKSLPGGLSELVAAVAAVLPRDAMRLQTAAVDINRVPGEAQLRIRTSQSETIDARAVVLATPAYVTSTLVATLDTALARSCSEIPYTSVAIVALAFDRDAVAHPLSGSGFVVPRVERSPILAATWLSSKWPGRAPDNRALVRAFIGGARDLEAVDQPDEELVRRALEGLAPIGIRGAPLFTRVYRWRRANAQHEVGHLARMQAIEHALAGQPGLFITGSGFRGVGIPDCVADGRRVGGEAAAWLNRTGANPIDGDAAGRSQ